MARPGRPLRRRRSRLSASSTANILSEPDVRKKFNQTGNFVVTRTPDGFAAFIRNEAGRWEKVLKEAGIRYE